MVLQPVEVNKQRTRSGADEMALPRLSSTQVGIDAQDELLLAATSLLELTDRT